MAMELFLKRVVGKKSHLKELMECDCIVVCEQQLDSDKNTTVRADIVIRFPKYNETIVVEAKSLNARTKAENAVDQAVAYANKMNYDIDKFTIVSLTNSKEYKGEFYGFKIVPLQWSEIVEDFDTIVRAQKKHDITLEGDFLNYLLKIKGIMNYYDIEVLSIPAGSTSDALEMTHVYECPSDRAPYKSRGEHKPLFIAFREKGGIVKKLYKVENLISTPIAGDLYEMAKEQMNPKYRERIDKYKEITQYDINNGDKTSKWVFFLDEEKSIELQHHVIYDNHNTFVETKRPLKDYFNEPEKDGYVHFS